MELFPNKVVMVQGVGAGLGKHLALGAAREGADVALAARSTDVMEEVAEEVRAMGRRALTVPTDIGVAEQCNNFVDRTVEEFGRIDVLINSANDNHWGLFEEMDLQAWRRVMDVNCFGYLSMSRAVVPHMKKQGGGSIVMINTMSLKDPVEATGAYAISKGAVSTATKVLAKELGPYNIRVNQVYMGYMWGPQVQQMLSQLADEQGASPDDLKASIEQNIILGRMPTDEQCSHAALFLASNFAEVITGASLDVNGGQMFGT